MPRYRKLHTKLCESYDFNDMPDDFTRLLWVMLPLQMSREGTIPADAVLIRAKVFPLRRDVSCDQIDAALEWFAERDMIRFYEVNGRRYLWATNFAKYQGNTTRESDSDYPPPPEQWPQDAEPAQDHASDNSRATHEQVVSKSSTDAVCSMQYADVDASGDSSNGNGAARAESNDHDHKLKHPYSSEQYFTPPELRRLYQIWRDAHRGRDPTPIEQDDIADLGVKTEGKRGHTSFQWIEAAMEEAARGNNNDNGFKIKYLTSIIDRWLVDGFQAPFPKEATCKQQQRAATKQLEAMAFSRSI